MIQTLQVLMRNMENRSVSEGEIKDALLEILLEAMSAGATAVVAEIKEIMVLMQTQRVTKPALERLLTPLGFELTAIEAVSSKTPVFTH